MFKTKFENGCMLVLGGAKSGKSSMALEVCNEMERQRIFLATAQAWDDEMEERIRRHQAERDGKWLTVEEPVNVVERINEHDSEASVILIDCLTLWLSNLFMKYDTDYESVSKTIEALEHTLSDVRGAVVLVSNEVSLGIVPENPMARRFRDMAGMLNQRMAALGKKVVMTVAGIPMVLKDE
jgi:adenosylcobinamide kinase/adenosylcobinamide-phosphate guanylyltransferase